MLRKVKQSDLEYLLETEEVMLVTLSSSLPKVKEKVNILLCPPRFFFNEFTKCFESSNFYLLSIKKY